MKEEDKGKGNEERERESSFKKNKVESTQRGLRVLIEMARF